MKSSLMVWVAAAALGACGGKSDGPATPGNGGTPPAAKGLSASPSAIDVSQYEGTSAGVSLAITSDKPLSPSVRWSFKAGNQSLIAQEKSQLDAEGALLAYLSISDGLAVGEHQGTVSYTVCEDDVATCAKPVAGSPVTLPVRINVKPLTPNLTPLSVIPGLGPWNSYHGNSAHTGYLPASFATGDFSPRWRHLCQFDCIMRPAVSADGVVYQARLGALDSDLTAVDEASGAERWRVFFDDMYSITAPVLANGRLYLIRGSKLGSHLLVVDPKGGAVLKQILVSPGSLRGGPVAGTDGGLYFGEGGGLTKRGADGEFLWRTLPNPAEYAAEYGVAVDERFAYVYSAAALTLLDVRDGHVVARIDVPTAYKGMPGIPVLASADRLFVFQSDSPGPFPNEAKGALIAFDLTALKVKWTLDGKYMSEPALGPEGIYVLNEGMLEVRNPDDGALLWRTRLDSPLASSPTELIVTRTHAFAGNGRATYAVELDKRKVAWTFPAGGWMTLSDRGVLYISAQGGPRPGLIGINLR